MFADRLKYEHEKCFALVKTAQGCKAVMSDNHIHRTTAPPAGVWVTEFLQCLWYYVTQKHDSA